MVKDKSAAREQEKVLKAAREAQEEMEEAMADLKETVAELKQGNASLRQEIGRLQDVSHSRRQAMNWAGHIHCLWSVTSDAPWTDGCNTLTWAVWARLQQLLKSSKKTTDTASTQVDPVSLAAALKKELAMAPPEPEPMPSMRCSALPAPSLRGCNSYILVQCTYAVAGAFACRWCQPGG